MKIKFILLLLLITISGCLKSNTITPVSTPIISYKLELASADKNGSTSGFISLDGGGALSAFNIMIDKYSPKAAQVDFGFADNIIGGPASSWASNMFNYTSYNLSPDISTWPTRVNTLMQPTPLDLNSFEHIDNGDSLLRFSKNATDDYEYLIPGQVYAFKNNRYAGLLYVEAATINNATVRFRYVKNQ